MIEEILLRFDFQIRRSQQLSCRPDDVALKNRAGDLEVLVVEVNPAEAGEHACNADKEVRVQKYIFQRRHAAFDYKIYDLENESRDDEQPNKEAMRSDSADIFPQASIAGIYESPDQGAAHCSAPDEHVGDIWAGVVVSRENDLFVIVVEFLYIKVVEY